MNESRWWPGVLLCLVLWSASALAQDDSWEGFKIDLIDVIAFQCPAAKGWPLPLNDAEWEALIKAARKWTPVNPDLPCSVFAIYVYGEYLKAVSSDESAAVRRAEAMHRRLFGSSP